MKYVKEGVVTVGIQPITLDAVVCLALLFHQHNLSLVITEVTGGHHKVGSLHYRGYALDLRTRDVPPWQLPFLLDAIRDALGLNWFVLQEKDHCHTEYDPHNDGGKGLP